MSDELYYRGSSSYELAVQNQLSRLQNSNVMLRDSMRDMEYGIRSDIRQSTFAIVASQQTLNETFRYGFNSVNNTLEIGFERILAKLDHIADSINVMSDKICSKLDEIHDIVNNPLLTQSRELYRRALTNYEKGYYEEALEDIKAAVEKNKTDFISWYLLGQIYLFGAGKFSNVINLDEAENAFYNAAKYIDADIGHSDEANKLASEIYYYLGYTRLVKSNDLLVENKIDESNKKLIEAESASRRAYQISKENILAVYEHAKELHFLGKDDEALGVIESLIRAEPTFAIKACNDKNFESIWDKIVTLIESLRDEIAKKAKTLVDKIVDRTEEKIKSMKDEVLGIDSPERDEFDYLLNFFTENKNFIEDELDNKTKNKLRANKIFYITKEDFSNVCNDNLSSLKSDILKYGQIENKDYLYALKVYKELTNKNSSGYFADNYLDEPRKKLEYFRLLYLEFIPTIKQCHNNYKINMHKSDKVDKKYNIVGALFSILAIGTLIPTVLTILDGNSAAGVLLLVATFVLALIAATFCIPKGLSIILQRTYVITVGLFSIVMFALGHPWFGVFGVVTTYFATIFWKAEKRKKCSSDFR